MLAAACVAAVLAVHLLVLTLPITRPPLPRAYPKPEVSSRPTRSTVISGRPAALAQVAVSELLSLPQAPNDPPSRAQAPELSPVSDGGSGWQEYIPRPLLSEPPQARQSPFLEWPPFDGQQANYTAILALYIDENGMVQRIEVESDDLPQPLADAARRAFNGLQFAPGKLDGEAVKSLVRIEVSFDQPPVESGAERGLGR
jgi:hypothetical protein